MQASYPRVFSRDCYIGQVRGVFYTAIITVIPPLVVLLLVFLKLAAVPD